jgi:hypothetical protein
VHHEKTSPPIFPFLPTVSVGFSGTDSLRPFFTYAHTHTHTRPRDSIHLPHSFINSVRARTHTCRKKKKTAASNATEATTPPPAAPTEPITFLWVRVQGRGKAIVRQQSQK